MFLALLARPGDVFELRGLQKGRQVPQVTTGYFDDMHALVDAAMARSGKDDGVYITLNPCNPALLARAPKNKVKPAGQGDTTSDRDVQARRHLLVDVDPVRPTGISSTDAEHAAAIALVTAIADSLTARGWPEPVLADSGNGGHLIYAIDLPVDDAGLVKRVLAKLSQQHTTPTLKVDEKVFNPSRISKIYGTLTRKGENTDDRPHRYSRILRAPDHLTPVTRAQLEELCPIASKPGASAPRSTTTIQNANAPAPFDLDGWIATHLPDAVAMPWSEGRKWLLPICPFNSSHDRREAYVTQKDSGMVAAGCQHESCFKSWRELRLHFDPNAYDYETRRLDSGHRLSDREPPPEVVYTDPSYAQQQAEIDAIAAKDRDAPTDGPMSTIVVLPPVRLITIPQALEDLWKLSDAPIYPTPFPTLNEVIGFGGLLGTQVYTVAAGTGRGKTSWVAELAAYAALSVPVLVASWEMIPGYFVARKAAGVIGVHSNQIIRGEINQRRVLEAMPYERFFFLHKPTVVDLRRAVDQISQQYGTPPLVIVDYIQKLADFVARTMSRPDPRAATSEVSEVLCDLGDSSKSAIVAVSAIGRGNNKRAANPRKVEPYELVDVAKESGNVEYDGAGLIVLSLSSEMDGEERVATITLAKARFGEEIHIDARYNGRRGMWRDCGRLDRTLETAVSGPSSERIRNKIAAGLANGPVRTLDLIAKAAKGRREDLRDDIQGMLADGEIVKSGGLYHLTDVGRNRVMGGA